jgi:hypothetical protein
LTSNSGRSMHEKMDSYHITTEPNGAANGDNYASAYIPTYGDGTMDLQVIPRDS